MNFKPRQGDLPREEILKRADDVVTRFGGPECAVIYFKFTCPQCGERCTFQEPNLLRERGICFKCGADEPVTHAGFALHINIQPKGEFHAKDQSIE